MGLVKLHLRCNRCGQQMIVDVHCITTDTGVQLAGGTLTGNWAERWINSHAEPEGSVA